MTQPAPQWPTSGAWAGAPVPGQQQWPAAGGQEQWQGQQQWPGATPPAPVPAARPGDHTPIIVGTIGILALLITVFVVYLNYFQG